MVKNNLIKNKKAFSLSGFAEAGIGILVILMIFALVIIPEMNIQYNGTHDPTFGLSTNATRTAFENYQASLQEGMKGDASTNTYSGVSVVSAWSMTIAGISMIINFITGGFIQNAVGLLKLGVAGYWLGWGLRLLFIFAMGFILLKMLFKVRP